MNGWTMASGKNSMGTYGAYRNRKNYAYLNAEVRDGRTWRKFVVRIPKQQIMIIVEKATNPKKETYGKIATK